MTDEEIWKTYKACPVDLNVDQADLHKFAKAIAAKEREACARLCDRMYRQETAHAQSYGGGYWYVTAKDCAKIIRARGE